LTERGDPLFTKGQRGEGLKRFFFLTIGPQKGVFAETLRLALNLNNYFKS